MVKQQFPPGWDAERVKALADYYDHRSDDEAIAEADAALEAEGQTLVMVPVELLPAIREVIARHQQDKDRKAR